MSQHSGRYNAWIRVSYIVVNRLLEFIVHVPAVFYFFYFLFFALFRERRCATKVDLLPWICKGLQSLAYVNGFLPFEVLMDASHGMLAHYKEKLATTENLNKALWSPKGALHLVSVHVRACPYYCNSKSYRFKCIFWRTNQLVILRPSVDGISVVIVNFCSEACQQKKRFVQPGVIRQ